MSIVQALRSLSSHISRPWKETALNLPKGVFVYIDDFSVYRFVAYGMTGIGRGVPDHCFAFIGY